METIRHFDVSPLCDAPDYHHLLTIKADFDALAEGKEVFAECYDIVEDSGELYYGLFTDYITAADLEGIGDIEGFYERNECNGFGCGMFSDLDTLLDDADPECATPMVECVAEFKRLFCGETTERVFRKTDTVITQYDAGEGFLLEIVETEGKREAWILHKDYGIKSFMFSLRNTMCETRREFLEMVAANFDDYKYDYAEDNGVVL